MNDSSHVFKGRHLDGVSCPICGGPVLPKPYDERKDSNLPYYRDLKKQSSKLKSAITIDLNFDDKSKLKLRAIAMHVGALVDELDAIDSNECTELSAKQIELLEHMIELNKQNGMSICLCDVERIFKLDNELPNQIKETTLSIGIASSKTDEVIADALKDLSVRLEGSE